MKAPAIAAGLALVLIAVLYLGFTNKPEYRTAYDDLRDKIADSLHFEKDNVLISEQKQLKKSDDDQKINLLKDLSSKWLNMGQPAIAADYLRQLADFSPSYEGYMIAGNLFLDQVPAQNTDVLKSNIVYGARYCFEQAQKLKPGDIDAQIGLASVFVEGTGNPMQGVMMLREIDAANPGNEKVNMQLGRFSMMSGQYDKAIERFSSVLEKDSLNLQSRFLLAQSYLGLQDTAKALNVLETAKSLAEPSMKDQIQVEINNLK